MLPLIKRKRYVVTPLAKFAGSTGSLPPGCENVMNK
jgi:hypothetical protein